MEPMLAASFDQYARYVYLDRLRRAVGGPEPLWLLDVGDPFGTIAPLFPGDRTVSIDLFAAEPVRDGHTPLIGSGLALPFRDGSFDLVAAHDVYEHLPAGGRHDFVAEMLRVSAGPVVLVAPFADPRVARCEALVNAYWVARLGSSLPALDEHAECGLPDLAALEDWLTEQGHPYRVHADGWLYHWVAFWILKGHLLSERREDLLHRVDIAFNVLLREADRRAPHYRRAVVVRPPGDYPPEFGAPVADEPGASAADLAQLTELAADLEHALPRGSDPWSESAPLRAWVQRHRSGGGALAGVAAALDTVLAAVAAESPHEAVAALPPPPPPPPPPLPSVGVVLVNLNGAEHLRDCLDSLAESDYPAELRQVVCVDNGSTDGSRELLAESYPWVRVLPQDANTGFAPAVNTGVAALDTDCVVLVNNDARVDREFLRRLVERYDPQAGIVCVAGQILSWDGSALDFADAAVNYYGMGQQLGYGTPTDVAQVEDGAELLFACGGAMLCDRRVFQLTGGLDPGFFAYFEDVDFGWRLHVLGYRVVLAAQARVFHRMHGTSARFPLHQRYLLYERNALRMILKNYDDANLARVLGPALLLMAKRAVLRGRLDRAAYDIGGDTADAEQVSRLALTHLHALSDVVDDLDAVMAERARIQRGRKRPDSEVLELFARPFWPVLPDRQYLEASEAVTTAFGLDRLFPHPRASRVLVVSADPIGAKMSGPAIRAWEIAKQLAAVAQVTVAVPETTQVTAPNVGQVAYRDADTLVRLAEAADVTILQGYALHKAPRLADVPTVLVVDLYDPWLFENVELHDGEPHGDRGLQGDVAVLNELLDAGDFFVCASERQRDYWLGMLAARDRVTLGHYAADRNLRRLIDVVPFGLPNRPPRHDRPVLKGVHPQIGPDDPVVLWGGGTWDWFDPVGTVEAFARVVEQVPNAKLYFLGFQLPSDNVKPMRSAALVQDRVTQLGLQSCVLFGDWVPYEEREGYLLEADVAVTAARDLVESRLAFRTRVLDYLWAGLPVVATAGDVLADEIREQGLGLVVPAQDPEALAAALVRLLTSPVLRATCADHARRVAQRYRWQDAVAPLREVVRAPWQWAESRAFAPRRREVTEEVRALLAQRNDDAAWMAQRLANRPLFGERALANLDEYISALEHEVLTLLGTVQRQNRHLDRLRRTPVAPAVRAARRVRAAIRRS